MSTSINVSIGDGGLPERNRQQTAANRQAYVQGKASQQAAQLGETQRAADRAAAGLDPATGLALVPGSSSKFRRFDQQPAANRRRAESKPEVLIVYWTATGPAATIGNVTWTQYPLFGASYATTTYQGQLATVSTVGSGGFDYGAIYHTGVIDESLFTIGMSDFTIEYWGNPGASLRPNVNLVFLASAGGSATSQTSNGDPASGYSWTHAASMVNAPVGPILLHLSEISPNPGWVHWSIQKQGTVGIFHANGQRKLANINEDNQEIGNLDQEIGNLDMTGTLAAPLQINMWVGSYSDGVSAIGQVRVSKYARYGTADFTPPSQAFYQAPT